MKTIEAFLDLDDEGRVIHLERYHADQTGGMTFKPEPDRVARGLGRRLLEGLTWAVYHDYLHKEGIDHEHAARQLDRSDTAGEDPGRVPSGRADAGTARDHSDHGRTRPTSNPDNLQLWRDVPGGAVSAPTILQTLWGELDRIVERLLAGPDAVAEDGRDQGRAEGVAYCIAVMTNPYQPDIEAVKTECMRRYREANE